MSADTVFLSIESYEVEWAEGRKLVDKLTERMSGYCIIQTFPELYFEAFTGDIPLLFESSFEGRVFGAAKEIRWVRQAGSWLISVLVESQDGDQPLEIFDRRYYLWGEYDAKVKCFQETRIPRSLDYPLPASVHPVDRDRAYIMVREYRLTEPTKGIEELDQMMDFLNKPFVVHHRYTGLGTGQEKET